MAITRVTVFTVVCRGSRGEAGTVNNGLVQHLAQKNSGYAVLIYGSTEKIKPCGGCVPPAA